MYSITSQQESFQGTIYIIIYNNTTIIYIKNPAISLEQTLGDSGEEEEKLPLTEHTSTRTKFGVGRHLPWPVGMSGKWRELQAKKKGW